MAEIIKRVVEDACGWWLAGAEIQTGNDEVKIRYVELPPETSQQARELFAQMCADELADELHAATA